MLYCFIRVFLPVCQLINSLSFSLRQRQKANQKLEHWGKNQRRKSQRGNRQRRKSQGRGMCPRKRKSRGEKGTTLTKVKPIKFLSFVCSYSYVIWYLSFLGPFLSLLLNIHTFFFKILLQSCTQKSSTCRHDRYATTFIFWLKLVLRRASVVAFSSLFILSHF